MQLRFVMPHRGPSRRLPHCADGSGGETSSVASEQSQGRVVLLAPNYSWLHRKMKRASCCLLLQSPLIGMFCNDVLGLAGHTWKEADREDCLRRFDCHDGVGVGVGWSPAGVLVDL